MHIGRRLSETPGRAHRDCDKRAVPNPLVSAPTESRLTTAVAVTLLRLLDCGPAG